jgi:cation:H+ antiporter
VLSAGYGVVLIGFVGFNLLLYRDGAFPSIGHVGLYTPVILLLYLLAMRSLYRYEKAQVSEYVEERAELYPGTSLKQAVGATPWRPCCGSSRHLAAFCQGLAGHGWSRAVGTLFVAAITSARTRGHGGRPAHGRVDLAIGNLFGSNLFNIASCH